MELMVIHCRWPSSLQTVVFIAGKIVASHAFTKLLSRLVWDIANCVLQMAAVVISCVSKWSGQTRLNKYVTSCGNPNALHCWVNFNSWKVGQASPAMAVKSNWGSEGVSPCWIKASVKANPVILFLVSLHLFVSHCSASSSSSSSSPHMALWIWATRM